MTFRNDINLLRALSVLFVLLYHFKIPYINNGFVGVDIFFVVSGYLMTAIIFKGFNQKTFKLKKFYIGRFKRIVPALLLVVVILFLFGYFNFLSIIYSRLVNEIVYVVTFISNIDYLKKIGYFDVDAYKKWFLHTWSLSVEFQFYLIYPLALLILKKVFNINTLRWFILLAFLLSLGNSIYESYVNPSSAYFLLQNRAWQLLAGGLVYLFPLNIKKANIVQYATVVLLLVFMFLPSFKEVWGGFVSTIPIILAVIFLYANSSNTYLAKNKAFYYIGLWSYSIYLWHWVVVVFLFHYGLLDNSYYVALGIVLSVLFGATSYYTVERNFKYKGRIFFTILIILIILSNIINTFDVKNAAYYVEIADIHDDSNVLINKLTPNTKYIVMGDSHAHTLKGMLHTLSKNKDVSVIFRTLDDTGDEYMKFDLDSVSNRKNMTLFLIRRWNAIDLSDGRFEEVVKTLSENFKQVVIMQQVPLQPMNSEDLYLQHYKGGKIDYDELYKNSVSVSTYLEHNKRTNTKIQEEAHKYQNVVAIDPLPYLCDSEMCKVGEINKAYYWDNDHVNGNGAMKLRPLFEPFFDRTEWVR